MAAGDDVRLRTVRWDAPEPRGSVVLVHGFGEHAGRYRHAGAFMAEAGWSVFAFDLRGHGESGGRRGTLPSFEQLLEDLDVAREEAARTLDAPGPSVLVGHSMGGLVVLRYAQSRTPDLAGVVLSAPWLATARPIPRWKALASRLLWRVAPDFALHSGVEPEVLSRDVEAQRAYAEDPLVHDLISSRMYHEVLSAQEKALDGGLDLPALLLVPGDDGLADSERTLAWARSIPSPHVRVERLPDCRHEPFNDPDREAILGRVVAWMDGRAGGAGWGGERRPVPGA